MSQLFLLLHHGSGPSVACDGEVKDSSPIRCASFAAASLNLLCSARRLYPGILVFVAHRASLHKKLSWDTETSSQEVCE